MIKHTCASLTRNLLQLLLWRATTTQTTAVSTLSSKMCCKKVNLYLPPSLHNFDQLGVDPSLLQSTTPKKLKGAPEPFYLQNLQRKTYPTLLIGDVNYCFTEQNGPSRYYYSKVLALNVDKYKDCCY